MKCRIRGVIIDQSSGNICLSVCCFPPVEAENFYAYCLFKTQNKVNELWKIRCKVETVALGRSTQHDEPNCFGFKTLVSVYTCIVLLNHLDLFI